jgi:hypothetical protein
LKKWYKKFNLSAAIADTLILVIGIIIARFFYGYLFKEFNIWLFTGLAVVIQIIHDILFYLFFNNIPKGYNYMLDFFKSYAKEVGVGAILGDSLMMILACLLSSYFATFSLNQNISFLESIQQNRLKKAENKLKKQTNELNKISNLLSTPLNRSIPKSVTGNTTTKEMIKEKKINLEANEMITQFELNNIEEKFKNGKINELTYQKDKKTLKNKLNKLKRELNSI